MTIVTHCGNQYSYLCRTNQIVFGDVKERVEWKFAPISVFSSMPELYMFIIGVTEQCNLRCTYCCYSGAYKNNRTHSARGMSEEDIDEIFHFIQGTTSKKTIRVAFYGGEPLLKFQIIQYAVYRGRFLFHNDIIFSVTTNATLLTPNVIDWLVAQKVDINISIDGTKTFHDKYRIDNKGDGSYTKVYDALKYIRHTFPNYAQLVFLQMTLASYKDIETIAEEWHNDPILKDFEPANIHGLAPNFSTRVKRVDYNNVKAFYEHLLDVYEKHTDWIVLKVLFDEFIESWKNRPIVDTEYNVPLATCMPVNTKLYIDSNKQIGICEKVADKYRIGNIKEGIDWDRANSLVQEYYQKRCSRCQRCPVLHMCNLCLTAIEYTDEQWDILCHNEQVYARAFLSIFCDMAERGMI